MSSSPNYYQNLSNTIENLPVPHNVRLRSRHHPPSTSPESARSEIETELFFDSACERLINCLDENECLMAPVVHDCVFPSREISSSNASSESASNNHILLQQGCNQDTARMWLATLLFLHKEKFRLVWW